MQTFSKKERLTSEKSFEELVEKGNFLNAFPLHIKWLGAERSGKTQVAFAVPKRIFKRAVDRNKLKRRLREAYRKNKNILEHVLDNEKTKLAILFVYTSKTAESYARIETAVVNSLNKILKKLNIG